MGLIEKWDVIKSVLKTEGEILASTATSPGANGIKPGMDWQASDTGRKIWFSLDGVTFTSALGERWNGSEWVDAPGAVLAEIPVDNNTGAILTQGTVVYPDSAIGVAKADAHFTSKSRIVAVIQNDIAIGESGTAIKFGTVFMNLSAFTAGDYVYLSDTAPGEITTTKPTDGGYLILIGVVEVAGANGRLFVDTSANELTVEVTDTNGFPVDQRAATVMSAVDLSREFTIGPTVPAAMFHYYVRGNKFESTGDQTVVWPDTEGVKWFYFDSTGLKVIDKPTGEQRLEIILNDAFVAYIYWSFALQTVVFDIFDERHGISMSPTTHAYLHRTRGAQFLSGYAAGDVIADGTGNNDTDAQFSMTAGEFTDEDLPHVSAAYAVGDTIDVAYAIGAQEYRTDTQTGFAVLNNPAGEALRYNLNTGGVWSLADVTNGNFVLYHNLTMSGQSKQLVSVMGQAEYATVADARAGATTELSSILTGFDVEESVPTQTFIYQYRSNYTNTVHARIRTTDTGEPYVDWRATELSQGVAPSDHNNLGGLLLAGVGVMWGHISDLAQTIAGVKTFVDGIISGDGTDKITIDKFLILKDDAAPTQPLVITNASTEGTSNDDIVVESFNGDAVVVAKQGDALIQAPNGQVDIDTPTSTETAAQYVARAASDPQAMPSAGGLLLLPDSKYRNITTNVQRKSFSGYSQNASVGYADRTFQIITTSECDFTHVRIAYRSLLTAARSIPTTTVCANDTNGTTADNTLVPFTFKSATLPPSNETGVATVTYSDWLPVSSVARIDGGTLPIVCIRSYIDAGEHTQYGNTSNPSGGWLDGSGDSNERLWNATALPGDQTSSEATAVSQSGWQCPAIEVQFKTVTPCINVVAIGNSITNGDSSGGDVLMSPVHFACTDSLSTEAKPYSYQNRGFSSQVTTQFESRAFSISNDDYLQNDIIVYSSFSPNDVSAVPTDDTSRIAAIEAMKPNVEAMIRTARLNSNILVLANGLPYVWSVAVDNARKSFNTWLEGFVNNRDIFLVDYDSILSDGGTPAVITAAYTSDTLHPNVAGYKLLGAELEGVLGTITTIHGL